MPRDIAGNYTLATPPVAPGTVITSAWANTTMADMATALTDSLDRYGRGAMLAPFRFNDGTEAQPGASFTSDTDTGLWLSAAGDLRMVVNGARLMRWNAGVVSVWTGSTWAQLLTFNNSEPVPTPSQIDRILTSVGTDWAENANVTITPAGTVTAVGFSGPTAGLHTGNVTGDLTGSSNGTHTGPVVGNVTGDLTGASNGTHTGPVVGDVTGNVTGNVTGSSGSCTGNSATATLATDSSSLGGVLAANYPQSTTVDTFVVSVSVPVVNNPAIITFYTGA